MRNADEVLVAPLAHLHVLLPAIVLADDEVANVFAHERGDDVGAGKVHQAVHAPVAGKGQGLQLTRGVQPFGKLVLKFRSALVVELVEGLQRSSVNKKRREAGLV